MARHHTIARVIAAVCALLLTAASTCTPPPIARIWVNDAAKLHDISKIEINYNCGEKPIKAYDPLSASLWILKAHTRCARTDCTWGRAKAIRHRDGTLEATFNTFSAVRKMVIHREGALLRADVAIRYRDPKRKPEHKSYYLHPKQ